MATEPFTQYNGWDSLNQLQNNVILGICVTAAVFHFLIWFQLFIHKTKFDRTFLISSGYMVTDLFLLLFYFIQYSVRIRAWIPVTKVFCYFEAYSMFYINLFESHLLTALNICRYRSIVRNENVYVVHRRKLILSSIIVPFWILINLIIQNIFNWCIVIENIGSSCSLSYTNIAVRFWNLIFVLFAPICISFYMLFKSLLYLKNIIAQQRVIHNNHHQRLLKHSAIFYSTWVIFWLPLVIFTFLDIDAVNEIIQYPALVANTIEILIDPFISIFLDQRFAKACKKSYIWIKHQLGCYQNVRVAPALEIGTGGQVNIS